jgi:hypothetical protein
MKCWPMSLMGQTRPSRDLRDMSVLPSISAVRRMAAMCQQRSLPPFAERVLRNIGSGLPRQSALMLAARITLPHFSVSAAI